MIKQTILVTGAARGIGRALTLALLADHNRVIACDIDNTGLESLWSEAKSENLHLFVADLATPGQSEELWNWVQSEFPAVSSLINNAGVYHGKPYREYSEKEIQEAIILNLTTPMYLSEKFAQHILASKNQGSIVNVASVAGEVGSSDAIYGATKAAVIGMTKSHAMNYGPNIRVNAVSPAAVRETDIFERIPKYRLDEYLRQEYLETPITPNSVADVIRFLIDDASRNLTGKIIPIDNGCYPR